MILRCILVEDEPMARKSLQRLCENHASLDLVGVFDNVADALSFLTDHSVDLIWLDIELPGLSGFDLLENLPAIPSVVMTTGKTEYAYQAFQYQVIDYLHKPITIPRFNLAVEKVLELSKLNKLATDRKEIYIKNEGRYVRLPFDSISYIENIGDYVKIYTANQTYVVYTTMKSLEEKLGPQFLRVHRSYIVHLSKIVDIEENTLVISDKVIPISRANKSELMSRLNLL